MVQARRAGSDFRMKAPLRVAIRSATEPVAALGLVRSFMFSPYFIESRERHPVVDWRRRNSTMLRISCITLIQHRKHLQRRGRGASGFFLQRAVCEPAG